MPKNTRKNRRTTKPNVFVQSNRTDDTGDIDHVDRVAESSGSAVPAPHTRARVRRTTQRASVRSEIYTRSLSAELKKMGALSGVVIVALVVLTFVL